MRGEVTAQSAPRTLVPVPVDLSLDSVLPTEETEIRPARRAHPMLPAGVVIHQRTLDYPQMASMPPAAPRPSRRSPLRWVVGGLFALGFLIFLFFSGLMAAGAVAGAGYYYYLNRSASPAVEQVQAPAKGEGKSDAKLVVMPDPGAAEPRPHSP